MNEKKIQIQKGKLFEENIFSNLKDEKDRKEVMKTVKEELENPKRVEKSFFEKQMTNSELIKLIEKNDYEGVQELFKKGTYVNVEVIKKSIAKFAPYYDFYDLKNVKNRLEIFKLLIQEGRVLNKQNIIEEAINKLKKYNQKNQFLKDIYVPEIIINDNALKNNEIVINSMDNFPFICVKDVNDDNILLQYILIGLNNSNSNYNFGNKMEFYIREEDKTPIYEILRNTTLNYLNNDIMGIDNKILENNPSIWKILENDTKKELISHFYKKEDLCDTNGNFKPPLNKDIIKELFDESVWSAG